MEFFNSVLDFFKNLTIYNYITFIIILAFLGVIITGIIHLNKYRENHLFILSKFRNKVERIQCNIKQNTATIYTFDNLAAITKTTYLKWSRSYSPKNSLILFGWINKFMHGTNTDDTLTFVEQDRESHYFVTHTFKIIKFDAKERTISLSHVTIPYANSKALTSSDNQSLEQIQYNIKNLKRKDNILIGYISFFPTNSLIDYFSYQLDDVTFSKIFQYITKYCNKKHIAVRIDENKTIVFIIYNYNKYNDKFIPSIKSSLKKFFTLSSIKDESFSICVNSKLNDNSNYDSVLKDLKDLAYYNYQKKNFNEYVFEFDPNQELVFKFKEEMTKKIETAINEDKFVFQYNPFYDIKSGEVSGYTVRIIADQNLYATYDYFLEQCFECKRLYEFSSYIVNKISKAFNENDATKKNEVFIELPPHLIKYLIQSTYLDLFKQIKNINYNICLKSHLINEYIRFDDNFALNLKDIIFNSEAQVRFCLDVSSTDTIPDDVAVSISSYAIDDVYYHNLQINPSKRTIINDLFYNYSVNKNIPLYSYNIKDNKNLEEVIANRIRYISGKVLHHDNSNVNEELPLEVKDQLNDLYNKYY